MIVNSSMVSKNYASMLNTQSQSGVNALAKTDFGSKMKQVSEQLLNVFDTNKNGTIDKVEFSSVAKQLSQDENKLEKIFSAMDQNSDGKIDSNELLSALVQLKPNASSNSSYAHKKQTPILEQNNAIQSSINDKEQKGLQSILMKNILSAYGISQSQTNGGSLSISV